MDCGHPLAVGVERQLEDPRQGDLQVRHLQAARPGHGNQRGFGGVADQGAVVGDVGVVAQRAAGEQEAQRGLVAERLGVRSGRGIVKLAPVAGHV